MINYVNLSRHTAYRYNKSINPRRSARQSSKPCNRQWILRFLLLSTPHFRGQDLRETRCCSTFESCSSNFTNPNRLSRCTSVKNLDLQAAAFFDSLALQNTRIEKTHGCIGCIPWDGALRFCAFVSTFAHCSCFAIKN